MRSLGYDVTMSWVGQPLPFPRFPVAARSVLPGNAILTTLLPSVSTMLVQYTIYRYYTCQCIHHTWV